MSERYLVVTSSNRRSVSKKLNTCHAFLARRKWRQRKLTSTIEDVRNLSSLGFEKNWRHRSSKMLSTSNSDLLLYFWRTCTRCFFTDDAAGGKITATMSRGLWKRAKDSEAVIFGYITNSGLNIFYIFHLLMRYSSKHTLRFYLRPIA